MVTKKRGRPPGTGSKQYLAQIAEDWRQRAITAEQKLAEHVEAHNREYLELQRNVAEAEKIARKTTAKLHLTHDILQGAIRAVMAN